MSLSAIDEGSDVIEGDYTITYDANGGTGSVPVDPNGYGAGADATVAGNSGPLSLTGFGFAGWNTAADGSGFAYLPGSIFIMPAANVTLYAQWAPAYALSFDPNGATGGTAPSGGDYIAGVNITLPGNTGGMTLAGYTFVGWNTQADGLGVSYPAGSSYSMPAFAATLYAEWSAVSVYTVTYDPNVATSGAVPVDGNAYTDGSVVTVLGNTGALARTGHSFIGWNTASDGSGAFYTGGGTLTIAGADVTLFAQWSANSYTLSYNINGAEAGTVPVGPAAYDYDFLVGVESNSGGLSRTGYTFTGWNTQPDGSGVFYPELGSFNMPDYDVTLYAQWSADSFQFAYDPNGATGGALPAGPTPYPYDTLVFVEDNINGLVNTGFVFAGWNDQPDGSGTDYLVSTSFNMPPADVTVYAQWSPAITAGDGTSMNPYQISSPEGLDAIRNDPAANYTLVSAIDLGVAPWSSGSGWEPISGFSGTLEGNSHTIHNLFIDRVSGAGLFDMTQGATIQNLALENVSITASSGWAGAVAGRTDSIGGGTTIANVYATGTVTGGEQLGGLVGLGQALTLSQSFSDVAVSSTADSVGGLVGRLSSGTVSDSYAFGSVDGVNSVGGLIGVLAGTATNTYAAGPVTGSLDVGGLVGLNSGTVNDSYFDEQTTGQITGAGLGYTTAEMMTQASFPAWDFFAIWDIVDGASYPFLRWQPAGTGARP